MNKFIIIAFILFFAFIVGTNILAKNIDDVQYPIAELGNCENQKECELYCEKPENMLSCVNFAEKNGFIDSEKAEKGRKMAELGIAAGPGNCRSQKECETYCENPNNIRECVIFAKNFNLMDSKELEEAEKILGALEKGAKLPGNCGNKKSCEAYCENPDHLEECVAFAEQAGFMKPEEAEMVRKTGGKGPGDCRGKEQCENYCQESSHMEECINFGIEHNLIPENEREGALKAAEALKRGVKMPNCRGKQECESYCQKPENAKECLDFAEAAGFMNPEESAQARKMMETGLTGGPGGCKSKEECEEFCRQPENTETCLDFAAKSGMMPPEESERIKNIMRQGPPSEEMMPPEFERKKMMEQIPPEFREMIPREMPPSGIQMPPELRQAIPQEFQQFIPPDQQLPPSSKPTPQILPFKNLIDSARALILEILR